MERFAFKGVASNLVTYLTDVIEMKNSSAAKFVNSWVGFTSMLPLIVSMLADSYCDKYSTILASSLLYAAVRSILPPFFPTIHVYLVEITHAFHDRLWIPSHPSTLV